MCHYHEKTSCIDDFGRIWHCTRGLRQRHRTPPKRPNLDKLFAENPHTHIGASGMDVGLPDGQMGNSEVGHTNIGAGRIVYQELTRITKSIQDGDFFARTKRCCEAMENCQGERHGPASVWACCPMAAFTATTSHLYALLELAKRQGLEKVYVHCFMDGRDVPPSSGKEYVEAAAWQAWRRSAWARSPRSCGRYYAMDRDNRWERVEKAYAAMVYGEGDAGELPGLAPWRSPMTKGVTDEFVVPTVCDQGRPAINAETIPSSSSTSAPTVPGRSPAPSGGSGFHRL